METKIVPANFDKQHWSIRSYGHKPYNIWPQPNGLFEHIAPNKLGGYIIYTGTAAELAPIIRASVAAYRARYRQPHISPTSAQHGHEKWLNDMANRTTEPKPIDRTKLIAAITIPPPD